MPDHVAQIALVPNAHTFREWARMTRLRSPASTPALFFSWVIQKSIQVVTRSRTHHTVLGLPNGKCLSAEPGGARVRDQSDYPEAWWSEFALLQTQIDHIVEWGEDHIGVPYGFFTDAAIALSFMLHEKTPKWIDRYLNSTSEYECAQLCDAAYQHVGIHLLRYSRGPAYPGAFEPLWIDAGWEPA